MEYRHAINNRRKLKKKPTIALVVIVVIAILLGGIFWFINREGPYDKYKVYNKDNKKFGTVEHYEKDDDSFFISLYYPKTKNSNLDKIVKDYQENYVKEQKINKNSKDILYMDYSINEVYNQFINLKFKTTRYDEDDKVVETKEKLKSTKGFCLDHLKVVLEGADTYLKGDKRKEFYDIVLPLMHDNMNRIYEDVAWFIEKYDYKNKDADWKNSKDAIQRGMQKLRGSDPSLPPHVLKK